MQERCTGVSLDVRGRALVVRLTVHATGIFLEISLKAHARACVCGHTGVRLRTHGRACAFSGRAHSVHTGVHLEKQRHTVVPCRRTAVHLVLQQEHRLENALNSCQLHSNSKSLQMCIPSTSYNIIQASTVTYINHQAIQHGSKLFLSLKHDQHACKAQGWKFIIQFQHASSHNHSQHSSTCK